MKYTGRLVLTLFSLICAVSFNLYLASIGFANIYIMAVTNLLVIVSWQFGKKFDKVKYESEVDTLTKAYNRRTATKIFNKLIKKANKRGKMVAVFFIDVDNFKTINDTYGHNIGDFILRKISDILIHFNNREKYVVRWGGDEFLVMIPCSEETEIQKRYKLMMYKVQSISEKAMMKVTISIGCAVSPQHGSQLNELVELADKQMIRTKRQKKQAWSKGITAIRH